MDKVFDQVEGLGNPVIWLGDQLDTKELIRGKCLNFWIRKYRDSKLNHYILVGNHDFFNLECEDHSLVALGLLPNVTLVDSILTLPEHNIAMLPYIHDESQLKSTLKGIPDNYTLFAHLELKGFDYGNGHICDHGLTPRSFSKFKRVVSGHFHKFQESGKMMYLGTPFTNSFGETDQAKYIATYDSDKGSLGLIEMNGLPQHRTITIDCDAADAVANFDVKALADGNHYRVILTGSKEGILNFGGIDAEGLDLKVITKPTDVDRSNEVLIEESISNAQKFSDWATDIKKIEPETVQLGLQILEAVRC